MITMHLGRVPGLKPIYCCIFRCLSLLLIILLILILIIPGHALHEKGLLRQENVGPLVSSQGKRALAVPVINRLSTAGQPLILFLRRLT